MTPFTCQSPRILALDPAPRGFGFAVLEGPESLIDWGVKVTRKNKHVGDLRKIRELLEHYRPERVVVEDFHSPGSRRCARVRRLIDAIRSLAAAHHIKITIQSRLKIRKAFAEDGAVTKHQIATAIAWKFPELAPVLPPRRKPWMSEDQRMHIFNAAALAFAYFHSLKVGSRSGTDSLSMISAAHV